jgi:hypothetical protein
MKIGKYDIGVTFAWDIWCIGAFWFGVKNNPNKNLNIFPFPFVVIRVKFIGDEE